MEKIAIDQKTKPKLTDSSSNLSPSKQSAYYSHVSLSTPVQDTCYTVEHPTESITIEAYLKLENSNLLIKLLKMQKTTTFCLDQFIGVQNLTKSQIDFEFHGKIPKGFSIKLAPKSGPFQIKNSNLNQSNVLTEGWYYYSHLLDYTIKETSTKMNKFWACDIMANCFPYKSMATKENNRDSFEHSIPSEYQEILKQNPFIRIASEVPVVNDKVTFNYAL